MKRSESLDFTLNYAVAAFSELANFLMQHPDKFLQSQMSYWHRYTDLFQKTGQTEEQPLTQAFDKRFQHGDWQKQFIFNFILQAYGLLSQQINELVSSLDEQDKKTAQRLRFHARQLIDSLAPTNFIYTNPEVLSKTVETNGANLMQGFESLLNDLKQGKGKFFIKATDLSSFTIGDNLAYTKGQIVYQNDIMQLIQYTASTASVYANPILMVPPWINKYYILDLQQENSLVKWLVDQGFTVFMISWVNPDERHRHKQFADYMLEGPIAALNCIKQITHAKKINVFGYCIGGTLLGCMLGYFAKQKETAVVSATFVTTLFDFAEPGDLGVFIDERQIALIESQMQEKGYLDGNIMSAVFNLLRANDLIWSSFVNQYLKGQPLKPFDLLFWNADSTNLPQEVHRFYLRNMYLNNLLREPNKLQLANTPIDLTKVTVPSYFLATQEDHIVPWKSCYESQKLLSGPVRFVLAGSGHVAGVINPPHKNKYGYWTQNRKYKTADSFLKSATYHKGSWWVDWVKWLKPFAGASVPIEQLNFKHGTVIEDAPGSYVKVKLDDEALA